MFIYLVDIIHIFSNYYLNKNGILKIYNNNRQNIPMFIMSVKIMFKIWRKFRGMYEAKCQFASSWSLSHFSALLPPGWHLAVSHHPSAEPTQVATTVINFLLILKINGSTQSTWLASSGTRALWCLRIYLEISWPLGTRPNKHGHQ